MSDEATIGCAVRYLAMDGPLLHGFYGAAVVLARDGEWPGNPPCLNRPSAWIRYTTREGSRVYRSVDIVDLELVAT